MRERKRGRVKGGGVWTPRNKAALEGDGVWCPKCHRRHGYMNMGIGYHQKQDGKWLILWSCPSTHNVIQEQELGKEVT